MMNLPDSVFAYMNALPEERKAPMLQLFETFQKHLPQGFEADISYKMPSFVVPFSRYPKGYHCDTKVPLPFISIASQKNFIAVYHMGLYAMPDHLQWFTEAYPNHVKSKLDMGKSCIRFKKPEQIPYDLMAELARRITVENWIETYENAFRRA